MKSLYEFRWEENWKHFITLIFNSDVLLVLSTYTIKITYFCHVCELENGKHLRLATRLILSGSMFVERRKFRHVSYLVTWRKGHLRHATNGIIGNTMKCYTDQSCVLYQKTIDTQNTSQTFSRI